MHKDYIEYIKAHPMNQNMKKISVKKSKPEIVVNEFQNGQNMGEERIDFIGQNSESKCKC